MYAACSKIPNSTSPTAPSSPSEPRHVEIRRQLDQYKLFVDGQPYTIKGVGLDSNGGQYFQALVDAGGNSFRTWATTQAETELAKAVELNLMVALGLDIKKELHGFDYNDEAAVQEQLKRLKTIVDNYKNHPNLLVWVAGNELNLLFDEEGGLKPVNPKAYVALKELIDYIHKVDPHHPVTTTFAGFIPAHLEVALKHAPNLDFLSVQVYGDLENIQKNLSQTKIDKPFMVTEYGPLGFWEKPSTVWGREIEEPSGVKASSMAKRIRQGILNNSSGKLIGNYAFLWGYKQERTPTWFGMFNRDGAQTARVDEMTKFWTGSYPKNQAPRVQSISIKNISPEENIYLKPKTKYTARIEVLDPDGDKLNTRWVLLKEVKKRSQGGALEVTPPEVKMKVFDTKISELTFETPVNEGEYRLFAYVKDPEGKVGNVNAPFFVQR